MSKEIRTELENLKVLDQTVIDDSVVRKSMSDIWRVASHQGPMEQRALKGRSV